jgi:hypothetical protein
MLLRDALDLLAYWVEEPPTHVSVAAFLRGPKDAKGSAPTREDLESLVAQFGRAG